MTNKFDFSFKAYSGNLYSYMLNVYTSRVKTLRIIYCLWFYPCHVSRKKLLTL